MYGVSQDVMERMQKRIKEKIYREMIEQQQKYKRAIEEEKRKDRYQPHIKTEPSYQIQSYPARRNNAKGFSNLDYESTFLPAINQGRRAKDYEQNQNRYEQPQPYTAYRSSDNLSFAKKDSKKKSTFDTIGEDDTLDLRNIKQQDPEESEQEKAQLYLEQCQQIIGSLKQLTNKNGRKVRPKANKYDTDEPMKKLLVSSSKNTRKPSYKQMNNQSFRINASTPIYRDHGYAKTPNSDYGKSQLIPIKAFWSSNFNKNDQPETSLNNNEFDEPETEKKKPKKEKIRENNINISPPKGQQEEEENPQNQEEEQEEEPSPPPRPKKAANDNKKKEKEKQRQKEKQKQKDKNGDKTKQKAKAKGENKAQQPQNAEDDPQKQQKRQQAIVKYLKKARVRGNLLYQKIQQRKKQSKDNEGGEPPAQGPAQPKP